MSKQLKLNFYVGCPYQRDCADFGKLCSTCRRNPKRSYYEPVPSPYYYPYYPIIPTDTITYTSLPIEWVSINYKD